MSAVVRRTKAEGRFGAAKLARVPKERILDHEAWEYLTTSNAAKTEPNWTNDSRTAVEVVPAPVGEASVLWNPA
ncbi:MAG TPA: DUF4185 domain-containing protein, partial [Chthoniobacterales bacterium]|nr:DUF4185 domain-containing protein [Chthoniobacterales bacterium]